MGACLLHAGGFVQHGSPDVIEHMLQLAGFAEGIRRLLFLLFAEKGNCRSGWIQLHLSQKIGGMGAQYSRQTFQHAFAGKCLSGKVLAYLAFA